MLIGHSQFFEILQSYRICWLGGRFSGGKTSLAVRMFRDFGDMGYRLVSNLACVWNDNPESVNLLDNGKLHTVVILDEGGIFLKAGVQVERALAYAAKMDCIFMVPSFWPPVRAAQVLTCQPVFNFKGAGLPLILYKWRVKIGAFADNGFFLWFWPSEIYGIYSRQHPGMDGSLIMDWLVKKTGDYIERYGAGGNGISGMEVTQQDLFIEAAENIAGAADEFSSSAISFRRRNRR